MSKKPKYVPLSAVFRILHGNKLDLNKMLAPSDDEAPVAFIGRSGKENGIVGFVRQHPVYDPFPAGAITVALGGAALSSFVQQRPFYTAQNIDVLTPLATMTLDVKLFYCQCIEANSFRYSTFGREANRTLKQLLVPPLEAVPDWVEGIAARAVKDLVGDLKAVL
ncbi:hypothetical protein BH11PLA1_BH11PLA1_18170 [soil metagenome]